MKLPIFWHWALAAGFLAALPCRAGRLAALRRPQGRPQGNATNLLRADPWAPSGTFPQVILHLCATPKLCEADKYMLGCKEESHLEIVAGCVGRPGFFELKNLSLTQTGSGGHTAVFDGVDGDGDLPMYNISGPSANWILLKDREPEVGDENWNITRCAKEFLKMELKSWMEGKTIDHFALEEEVGY